MAEDALKCFQALLDSVPDWITDLEALLSETTERQQEATFAEPAPRPPGRASLLSRVCSKSSSLKSHRSSDARNPRTARQTTPRKRKTSSSTSDHQSGPPKIRSRGTAVGFYDGQLQKRLETLVRSIGGSRNTLRKGKMSARLDSLVRTGSSSSDSDPCCNTDDDDAARSKLGPKDSILRPVSDLPSFRKQDGTESFDKLDALLERSQTLCEKAAHQLLRDGDCGPEVKNAVEQLCNAKQVLASQLPVLQKKADKAVARRRRSEERLRQEEEDLARREREIKLTTVNFPSDVRMGAELEADDSDSDDAHEISIAALRLPGKARMRSTRMMMAH